LINFGYNTSENTAHYDCKNTTKEVINIYKKHRHTVDNFISTLIMSLPRKFSENVHSILKNHDYIELLCAVEKDFHQSAPHNML